MTKVECAPCVHMQLRIVCMARENMPELKSLTEICTYYFNELNIIVVLCY